MDTLSESPLHVLILLTALRRAIAHERLFSPGLRARTSLAERRS